MSIINGIGVKMKYIFLIAFLIILSGEVFAYSSTFSVQPKPAPTTPLQVMEIEGNTSISSKSVKNQLKDLAEQIKLNKDIFVYIISYSRKGYPKEAKLRANLVKNYLVKKLQVDSDRIITVDGGSWETQKIKIYFVPAEADKPEEDSTINTNKIQNYQVIRKKQKWRVKQTPSPTNQWTRGRNCNFLINLVR